ncbi:MAG: hypothetical protein ACRETN_01755 [Nevskiales bacterium]
MTALAIPAYCICALLARVALARTEVVDMVLADRLFAGGGLVLALCFAVSLLAGRAGKDAPWTAHMLVVLFGAWVAAFIAAFGLWSTPVFAWYPLVVVLVALWYGEQIGWFAFGYGLFVIAAAISLETSGITAYAPAVINRSLDAQQTGAWQAAMIFLIMAFYLFCFALSVLVMAARKLQDRRLQAAQKLIRRYVPSQLADKIIRGRALRIFQARAHPAHDLFLRC